MLLAQSPDTHDQAEQYFRDAIAVAQQQQAKSWELRAATSLARLLYSDGRLDAARACLSPVYQWFTEGLATPDLTDALAVLDELS